MKNVADKQCNSCAQYEVAVNPLVGVNKVASNLDRSSHRLSSICGDSKHLKMMRLLFLCLLLLLPAVTAVSEETEGSADGDLNNDDEDFIVRKAIPNLHSSDADKTTGVKETPDQLTLILVIAAVVVLTLSGVAIIIVLLVRRRMQNRERGIYFVPTEQDQKGAV